MRLCRLTFVVVVSLTITGSNLESAIAQGVGNTQSTNGAENTVEDFFTCSRYDNVFDR